MSSGDSSDPRFGRGMLSEWLLDPAVVYLNHGTVGATPRRVLSEQSALRDEIECNPACFHLRGQSSTPLLGFARDREPRLRRAAREVAEFVGARGEDLVFSDNTTTAINAVLRSFDFEAQDEILLFDHGYGAIRNAAEYLARVRGVRVVSVALPFPETNDDAVVRAFEAAITARTRLAIVDHITAPSALVLPVARLARACRERGVLVLVDGAHAPGAIPLDIPLLGVDWYAGNLHKWGWAPRSCALLWVDPARQTTLHPTTISWGLDHGFTAEFDWVGTRDVTPYLVAPAAIRWMRELGVGRVQSYNHALAWQAGHLLAMAWGTRLPAPESMIGTMVAVRVPHAVGTTKADADRLRDALWFEDQIEVHVHAVSGGVWVRVSAQIYNELADIEQLAGAVRKRL